MLYMMLWASKVTKNWDPLTVIRVYSHGFPQWVSWGGLSGVWGEWEGSHLHLLHAFRKYPYIIRTNMYACMACMCLWSRALFFVSLTNVYIHMRIPSRLDALGMRKVIFSVVIELSWCPWLCIHKNTFFCICTTSYMEIHAYLHQCTHMNVHCVCMYALYVCMHACMYTHTCTIYQTAYLPCAIRGLHSGVRWHV